MPNAQSLIWNVKARAEACGLDPIHLSFRAELYAGSILPIWKGEAQAVSIEALGRLALALETPGRPFSIGDLFTWNDAPFLQ